MLALLKRRWLLLTFAFGLLGCSFADFGSPPWPMPGGANRAGIYTSWGNIYFYSGGGRDILLENLADNIAEKKRFPNDTLADFNIPPAPRIHAPAIGSVPRLVLMNCIFVKVPLWLPLSVVLGWLVFREMRWREKCAKAKELPESITNSAR